MTTLFDATTINGMRLRNRFVRSATWEGMAAADGRCTSRLVHAMEELVDGEVGLIITGFAYVRPDARVTNGQIGIHSDALVPALRRMTDAVHERGGTIVMQIVHGGVFANPALTGRGALGPSVVEGMTRSSAKEMSVHEIGEVVESFGQAARRVKEAGFDGVQMFAGHGYLLGQFLSPFFNKRSDAYGGDLDGRVRIVLEVLANVRMSVGDAYPVLIKLNSEDFLDGGLTVRESRAIGVMLSRAGIDAIELSGGTWISGTNIPARKKITSRDREAYFREAARLFRDDVHVPLILVGGIRSFRVADELVQDGVADYISMCRPLIREPGLIARWKGGDRTKAACLSCNQCLGAARSGDGVHCVVERRIEERRKRRRMSQS